MGNNNSSFGSSKTSVYKVEQKQEGTEQEQQPNEIIKIRPGYYKNSKGIYYDGVSLNLSKKERSSFKKLKYGYAKTKKFVFYKGQKIEFANPETFITINRKNMPEEFEKFNSVIGMDFENEFKRIYQFGIKIFEIKI